MWGGGVAVLMPSVAHKSQGSAVGSGGQCTVSKSNEFMGGGAQCSCLLWHINLKVVLWGRGVSAQCQNLMNLWRGGGGHSAHAFCGTETSR